MKTVLLLGVGRSTHTLIKYLVNYSKVVDMQIVLADQFENKFIIPYLNRGDCRFTQIDINDTKSRKNHIRNSDLVISMLPPKFHFLVAQDCILFRKNLITASYVSKEIQELDSAAKKSNKYLFFKNRFMTLFYYSLLHF